MSSRQPVIVLGAPRSLNKPVSCGRGRARSKALSDYPNFQVVVSSTCNVAVVRNHNGSNRALAPSAPCPSHGQNKGNPDMQADQSVTLLRLNGDVLNEIASYVRGRDALNLALTARRIYDFAIHRVAVVLVCRTRTDLINLHSHLLAGDPKVAVYLRSLTIMGSTFIERPWQEDPNWIFPKNTYDYSDATLVGDILKNAPNLSHLTLEHCAPLLQHDPRIGPAVASMSRLARLELCHLDSNALPLFQELRSRPRVLCLLAIKVDSSMGAKRVLGLVRDILEVVSTFKELHTLDLDLKGIPGSPEPRVLPPPLPQIRHLSVHWWHPQMDIAKVFPNLEVFEQHINSVHLKRSPQRPLRRLSITEMHTFESARYSVHLLHLRRYPRELRSFRRTIYETSPVGLSLHCFIDAPVWLKYWQQLPRAAPRLRFMDVHCHTWERLHEPGWVTLRRYSLVCLRIVAPQPPTPDSLDAPWHDEDIQTLAELPDRIVQVMPSLRYIAWAAKRRAPGGDPEDYAWYEDEYDCAPADYKWYRVVKSEVEGEVGRTLKAISANQGERVRRFLLGSDLDAITNIDAHLRL
ncbi:hypothetical protein BD414DRAFT_533275 [Trametes punicea]|nr:hypothetical protein BD414DRAFT_533275 [Trametes punicea]